MQGRSPAPPEYSRGGRDTRPRSGTSAQEPSSLGGAGSSPPDTPEPLSPGPLSSTRPFPEYPALGNKAWRENGRSHPQSLPVAFLRREQPFFPFSRKSARLQPLDVAFSQEVLVQRGQVRLPAGDTLAEPPPRRACHLPRYLLREPRKQPQLGFQERWGLGSAGGAEATWGRTRSGVLQPVGQVELEFRRVGGREAASGKRKKTQAAGVEHPGACGGEPGRPGRWSARRLLDLEGLPLLSDPDTSARGRQYHVSPVSLLPW